MLISFIVCVTHHNFNDSLENVTILLSSFRIYSVDGPCKKSSLISTLPSPQQQLSTKTCKTNNKDCLKKKKTKNINTVRTIQRLGILLGIHEPGEGARVFPLERNTEINHGIFVVIGILITCMYSLKR